MLIHVKNLLNVELYSAMTKPPVKKLTFLNAQNVSKHTGHLKTAKTHVLEDLAKIESPNRGYLLFC